MARVNITPEEVDAREKRALEWAEFRAKHGFTQKLLADTMRSIDTRKTGKRVGISRRTVQQVEAGLISPHLHTLELFSELKSRHENNKIS